VAAYGITRLTADVDVTAAVEPDEVRPLVEALEHAGFDLRVSDPDDFVRKARVLPFRHQPTAMMLDIVLAGPGLEEEFLRRARTFEVGGVPIPVISPEDLVATKILAGRVKDLEDVRSILRVLGKRLDLGTIRGTLGLLERALDRRDLLPELERALGEPRKRGGPGD
jgi:hypothetical protein